MSSTMRQIEEALDFNDYVAIIEDLFTAANQKVAGKKVGLDAIVEPDKKTISELIGMAIEKAPYCSGLAQEDFKKLCRWAQRIGNADLHAKVMGQAREEFPDIEIEDFEG